MTGTARWATLDTPTGPFTVIADDDGTVLASGWTADLDELAALAPAAGAPRAVADLGPVTKAVLAYYDGDLAAIDAVPVRQRGGAFLDIAREQLRAVRPGTPVTYTELAARTGRPAARWLSRSRRRPGCRRRSATSRPCSTATCRQRAPTRAWCCCSPTAPAARNGSLGRDRRSRPPG